MVDRLFLRKGQLRPVSMAERELQTEQIARQENTLANSISTGLEDVLDNSNRADDNEPTLDQLPGDNSTSGAGDSDSNGPSEHMSVQSLILSILCVIAMFWCALPRTRRRAASRVRRERLRQQRRREKRTRMHDPKYREEVLLNSLWIQKVLKKQGHQLRLGPVDAEENEAEGGDNRSETGGSERESVDSYDETNACAICLEPYEVGDILAWSRRTAETQLAAAAEQAPPDEESGLDGAQAATANPDASPSSTSLEAVCTHVFHKDCIHAWLMNPKHDDCPACRAVIVREPPAAAESEDGAEIKPAESADSEMLDEDEEEPNFSNSVAFVVVHGLVSRARRVSYSLIGSDVCMESFDDEPLDDDGSIAGMEMVPPPAVVDGSAKRQFPLPLPLRRATSLESGPGLRRRSSFGAIRSVEGGSAGSEIVKAAYELRRTLSGGTVVKGSAGSQGGTVLVPSEPRETTLPLLPRPVWSEDAERALSETIHTRLPPLALANAARTSSTGSAANKDGAAVGGFRKVFRKEAPQSRNFLASPANKPARGRKGYALLDTGSSQRSLTRSNSDGCENES